MRGPMLLAAAALLLLVLVAARGESPVPTNLQNHRFTPGGVGIDLPGLSGGGDRSGQPGGGGAWLVYAIVGVLALVLLVVAVVLSVRIARRTKRAVRVGTPERNDGGPGAARLDHVEKAIVESRDLLARPGGVPGDAVIQAWLALEQATHHRAAHETATEFTAALPADERALADLRTLYQRARFGREPTTSADAEQARDALDRILATLR